MGARQFMTTAEGATAKEAFAAAREEAWYDHGHAGYTGTIAEKDGFVTLDVPSLTGATEEVAREYVQAAMSHQSDIRGDMQQLAEAVGDKWGPAGHIDLGGGRHLFFGWASS